VRVGPGHEPEEDEEKGQAADQMGPSVPRFCVHRQNGLETYGKRRQLGWWTKTVLYQSI
jgi:hypothetical protein